MPGLRKQHGCFTPSFQGGFPCLWHLSLPHSVPRDAFGGSRTACASHRVEEAAPLYRHLCSQQGFSETASNLRAGMQHSPEFLLLLSPLLSLQLLPCTPGFHQGLCPAGQPKITRRTGPEPVHFPDIVPEWSKAEPDPSWPWSFSGKSVEHSAWRRAAPTLPAPTHSAENGRAATTTKTRQGEADSPLCPLCLLFPCFPRDPPICGSRSGEKNQGSAAENK